MKLQNKKNNMNKCILSLSLFLFFAAECVADNATLVDNSTRTGEMNASENMASNGDLPLWITSQYSPYIAGDKVDPFVSFVKVREYEVMQAAKKTKEEHKAATPLETVDVHTLKLIGVIEKPGGVPVAMVEFPDGKGYLIRQGMTVGLYDGVVTSISKGVLNVEEHFTDVFNEKKTRVVSLRLRQEKE